MHRSLEVCFTLSFAPSDDLSVWPTHNTHPMRSCLFKPTLCELVQVISVLYQIIFDKFSRFDKSYMALNIHLKVLGGNSERNFQRGRKVTALKAWLDNDIYGKQQQQQQKQGWIEESFQDSNYQICDELKQRMNSHPRAKEACQRYLLTKLLFFFSLCGFYGARLCLQPVICYWPPFLQQST